MEFIYNQDQETRNSMLELMDECGGTQRFKNLKLETLKKLIFLCFVDLGERQNESPSIKKFLAFMEKYPSFTAHGYVVNHPRDDYRLTIEGLSGESVIPEEVLEFAKFNRLADEFDCETGYQRSWWD